MSVAGLGLSLGESAQAKNDPAAEPGRAVPLGLEGLLSDAEVAPAPGAAGPASIPSGPLDVTLSWPEAGAAPSEEDRAAVALAMVLMAEPSAPAPSRTMPDFAAPAPRWEPSAEFLRDFRDLPSPAESVAATSVSDVELAALLDADSGPGETGHGVDSLQAAPAAESSPLQADAQIAITHVDLDLSAGPDAAAGSGAAVDVNLAQAEPLDLNLDLGVALDLNLDFAPEVDLRLDRPPVFAVTRLRPLGQATPATAVAGLDGFAGGTCAADDPVVAMHEVPAPVTAPTRAPAQAAASMQAAASPRSAAPVSQVLPAAPAVDIDVGAKVAPTIVVASHTDRVLRGLEALLASDDTAAARLGARSEVFVTSHAEKALLMLASTCAGEEAAPAGAEPALRISKVEPAARAAACKPMARAAPARPARRSAIGGEAVALSQGDLDKVRGGFDAPNGLKISFGIERAVYINGALVTTTSLNVSDLGKVSGGAAAVTAAVAGSGNLTLVQNGAGNTFVTGPISAGAVGTIVQNTLNDQKIQSVTAINASVNSLQMVRAQNFQSTLRSAVIDSLRR